MFPGWLLPAAKPSKRKGVNPFTGKPATFVSWLPASAEGLEGVADPMPRAKKRSRPIAPVLPADGEFADYQRAMEKGAPAALRAVPHAVMKGIFGIHLDALASSPGVKPSGRPARIAPDGVQIDCLPDAAVAKLAALDERKLAKVAKDWSRDKGIAADLGDDPTWVLRRVHALARLSAGHERKVCVFVEPL
jgi:hypothetical protein